MTTEITTPTPATTWAQTEIDLASTAAIKDIVKEFDVSSVAADSDLPGQGAPTTQADPVTTQTRSTDPAASAGLSATGVEQDTAKTVTEALGRADVRAEIDRFQLEQRLAALETENRILRDKEKGTPRANLDMDNLGAAIRTKPIETLTQLGLNPDEVIRVALAQKLGDKASPELRKAIDDADTKAKIAVLEAKLHNMSQKEAQRAYFDQVNTGAVEFVRKLATSEAENKEVPLVSRVAKSDGARIHAEIMEEIMRDAQARAAKEPSGQLLSYDAALKRVEARWGAMHKLLSGQTPISQAGQPALASTQAVAAQNASQKVTNTPGTAIKTPDRPLPPWLQRKVTEEDGLKAAVQEFIRAESQTR